MPKLLELRYNEVIKRLQLFGFRFYRHGKGSHELWVRDADGKVVPVPHHKGKAIRKQYGLSQAKFARLLGINVSTLRNREQGRRKPEGPARVLLRVAAKHPEAILDVVSF